MSDDLGPVSATVEGAVDSIDPILQELVDSALKERLKCPQFRVLVIGKANAGKTTIIEKMCNATVGEQPVVRDGSGELVRDAVTEICLILTLELLSGTVIRSMPRFWMSHHQRWE
jgi:tRNA U34 5-carboxymethylaminomethyl modifying GTPase MnmE/TrmE